MGNVVVVVVVVVVVTTGFTHPTMGTVVTDGSPAGGHNTGMVVDGDVVVVALDTTAGADKKKVSVAPNTAIPMRRMFLR